MELAAVPATGVALMGGLSGVGEGVRDHEMGALTKDVRRLGCKLHKRGVPIIVNAVVYKIGFILVKVVLFSGFTRLSSLEVKEAVGRALTGTNQHVP